MFQSLPKNSAVMRAIGCLLALSLVASFISPAYAQEPDVQAAEIDADNSDVQVEDLEVEIDTEEDIGADIHGEVSFEEDPEEKNEEGSSESGVQQTEPENHTVGFNLMSIELTEEQLQELENNDDDEAEDGDAASSTNDTEPTNAYIETGDATAGAGVTNEANVNEVDTSSSSTATSTASSTDETGSSTPKFSFPFGEDEDSLTINGTNTATTSSTVGSGAGTGSNKASSSGNSVIITGDATAYADVLNVVNTNIVNSQGLVQFMNEVLGYQNFDLTNDFMSIFGGFNTSQTTSPCNLSSCNDGKTNVTIDTDNDAVIDNDVTVTANTGGNSASGTNAYIETGDAYAAANIVNVANTNIVDSNYLLLVFNNFDDYAGNIVLPNSSVFSSLFGLGSGGSAATVNNDNTADINNNLGVTADTGNNTATGNNNIIATGDASASGNVDNIVNGNFLNTNSFKMLIRVHGNWTGTINGLPDGMTWEQTPQGIQIMSEGSAGNGTNGNVTVNNTNTASINNNVNVFALSGDNKATGQNTGISTGNATANASIVNMANTNIIGSNWATLILNIYGDWSGNLSFGQHDLWIGAVASSEDSPIMPGSIVDYTFTVFNKGDMTATNVKLGGKTPNNTIAFSDFDAGSAFEPEWHLENIPAGGTKEFTVSARASELMRSNIETPVPLVAAVESNEDDVDESNNMDTVTVYVGHERSSSNSFGLRFPGKLEMEKTASHDFATPGTTVDYTVTFYNKGGQIFDAVLVDIIEDQDGNIIQEQSWPLGTMFNDEEITVEYSITLREEMDDMVLTNSAQVLGFHGSKQKKHQRSYESPIAEHVLTVGTPQVLGIQADFCPQYLTTYIKAGASNDVAEVEKLQTFLNEHMGAGLLISGYYDGTTELAVRAFQEEYRADILDPWGMTAPSGYVYYTTQKKINEIYCNFAVEFPLSSAQMNEIDWFKSSETTNATNQHYGYAPEAAKKEEILVSADDTSDSEPVKDEDATLSQANSPAAPRSDEEEVKEERDPNLFRRISNFIFSFLPRATAGR